MCKDGVNMLEKKLAEKASKDEVEKVLMTICSDIPFPTVSAECSQNVAENFDQIYDDVVVLMNPDLICPALGLCSTSASDDLMNVASPSDDQLDEMTKQLLKSLPDIAREAYEKNRMPVMGPVIIDTDAPIVATLEENVGSSFWSDCKAFMTDLQGVAANNQSIIDDIKDLVKEQCETLGEPIAELCSKAVDVVIPLVVDAISSNDVDTICQTIYMCPMEGPRKQLKMSEGNLCNDCQAFTEDWQSIIQNNKSIINEMNGLVKDQICSQFFPFEHECNRKVDALQKELLPQIETADAYTICETMYMCDYNEEEEEVTPVVETPEVAVDPVWDTICI
jgi:hypothetical protein